MITKVTSLLACESSKNILRKVFIKKQNRTIIHLPFNWAHFSQLLLKSLSFKIIMRKIFKMLANTDYYYIHSKVECHEFVSFVADVDNFCFEAKLGKKPYIAK